MRCGSATHFVSRFDRQYPCAPVAEQARRDPGSCSDVCDDQVVARRESSKDRLNRSVGIGRPILDVVSRAVAEASYRIHFM